MNVLVLKNSNAVNVVKSLVNASTLSFDHIKVRMINYCFNRIPSVGNCHAPCLKDWEM